MLCTKVGTASANAIATATAYAATRSPILSKHANWLSAKFRIPTRLPTRLQPESTGWLAATKSAISDAAAGAVLATTPLAAYAVWADTNAGATNDVSAAASDEFWSATSVPSGPVFAPSDSLAPAEPAARLYATATEAAVSEEHWWCSRFFKCNRSPAFCASCMYTIVCICIYYIASFISSHSSYFRRLKKRTRNTFCQML